MAGVGVGGAPALRQWPGGRRGSNSSERSGGADQCVSARASMSPGGELRMVERLWRRADDGARLWRANGMRWRA
jgi:hypothetical protein